MEEEGFVGIPPGADLDPTISDDVPEGTGTTGAVAKKLGRIYIGIENKKQYIDIANKRIKEIVPHDEKSLEITKSKRNLPRIPFGFLIEKGILMPVDNSNCLIIWNTEYPLPEPKLINSIHEFLEFK